MLYNKKNLIPLFLIALIISFPGIVHAKVSGSCGNCHTMHNSQNGNNVLRTGAGVGWNDLDQISGSSPQETPAGNLLVTNCVGCHSSTTGDTIIIKADGTKVPIVYNTTLPTQNILAGGNFYWVGQEGDDSKGHNVLGVADIDKFNSEAPGNNGRCGDATSCHATLASPSYADNTYKKTGCQGCHFEVTHHEDNDVYRFLKGHEGSEFYVEGVEDPSGNWEQAPSLTNSNRYKGVGSFAGFLSRSLKDTHSISSFCAGCHNSFHEAGGITDSLSDDFKLTDPWKRHPTDIDYPSTGEFEGYNPTETYNNMAPVAWIDPSSSTGPVVMCLSCHRPHGSDQPDMLRWNYNNCNAGPPANSDCGCTVCHAEKDG